MNFNKTNDLITLHKHFRAEVKLSCTHEGGSFFIFMFFNKLLHRLPSIHHVSLVCVCV
jgi:hypothetical protein